MLSYEVVEEREPPQNRGILADQTIRLSGIGAHDKCPHLLRRVVAVRADTGDILVFLTNHHQLGASTVAAIYKERWQIELLLEVQQRYKTVEESMVLLADPTAIQDMDKREEEVARSARATAKKL